MIRCICTILLLWSQSSFAITPDQAKELTKRLDQQLERSKISRKDVSIYIAAGDSGRSQILSVNERQVRIPASITKIVTAAVVLENILPGTKLKTQLYADLGKVKASVLEAPLYLKGGGDPGFVSETMWFLTNSFTRSGIKEIKGDLIVDDTLFDSIRFDSSRQEQRVDRAYDAPTGAMSFNWNSVNFFVRPGHSVGEPAQVFVDPPNSYITLKGQVRTVARGKGFNVNVDRSPTTAGDTFTISGSVALGHPEKAVFASITKPDLWAGENLKAFLSQRGITVRGAVKAGKMPSGLDLVGEAESKPIEAMVTDMNKFSNNYVAEMLIKNLAVSKGEVGSLAAGMKHLNAYMKSLNVSEKDFSFPNPSGLTRDNKVTAQAMWIVLENLKEQFRLQPEFISSLPIAGVDGTLRNRMKGTPGERWVRAKTGLLDGVVSLAGYAGRKDGSVIPFVLIYNGNADEGSVRALFDRMATTLVEAN
jgi:D-alanyl-D-alanine carboxypeptidase/D-alanyl-D-alanine-endopeptidase (penicillin-binding protein 4)